MDEKEQRENTAISESLTPEDPQYIITEPALSSCPFSLIWVNCWLSLDWALQPLPQFLQAWSPVRPVSEQSDTGGWRTVSGALPQLLLGLAWVYVLSAGQQFWKLLSAEYQIRRWGQWASPSPQKMRCLVSIISLKQYHAISTTAIGWIQEWWIHEQSRQMSILQKHRSSHWLEHNEKNLIMRLTIFTPNNLNI